MDFGIAALALALLYNGWQLNEIRRISRACYVELSMSRWEIGKSGRTEQRAQGASAVGGKLHNLAE
jgi:hypothetical protein